VADPTIHPLCCHSCAPVVEVNRRARERSIPQRLAGKTITEVLARLGWKNPFKPGTAELKEFGSGG
jgi:hypothetical protein